MLDSRKSIERRLPVLSTIDYRLSTSKRSGDGPASRDEAPDDHDHREHEQQGQHAQGLTLRVEVTGPCVPIETDAGKLKQVLINLIGNSLKFTERGSIDVRLRCDPDTRRPFRIDVTDTGIGIPEDRLEAIFEAFEQADRGTARKFGGTGLGLAISRSLCRLMGHVLQVSSVQGKGTTFSILLASDLKLTPRWVRPVTDARMQAVYG